MTQKPVHRMTMQFDDNQLVPLLFGEFGAHLSRIESLLEVDIANKGNEVLITGDKSAIKATEKALNHLWERINSGLEVGLDEVDAAIRITDKDMDKATRELAKAAFLEPQIKKAPSGGKEITARTPSQAKYLAALEKHELTFGLGPAGTGKTYLAVAQAVSMLRQGTIDKLILCRPAVEAGENLGFLPGDLQEKIDPYLRPIYDALNVMMPPEIVVQKLSNGDIEVAPLAYMRGRTLSNAFIILDEAQNTTIAQMKMALTRIGENSRMAITGDPSQIDLPRRSDSGLINAVQVLKDVKDIAFIEFDEKDVVRHHLVAKIVHAYDKFDKSKSKQD